jgi:hypothetical protein
MLQVYASGKCALIGKVGGDVNATPGLWFPESMSSLEIGAILLAHH